MTDGPRSRAGVALALTVSVGFAITVHLALVEDLGPPTGALLSLVLPALLLLWLARRARRRAPVVLAAIAAGAALWIGWSALERNFPNLFFVEHAGANLVLAIVFGRTLAAGHESLCTRFARLLHKTLPPEVVRYTRKVTAAWTIFFATLFLASCILYFAGFIAAWSVLANILTPLLIAAMFVVEYVVRHRVLPDWERVGVLGGIRAFSRHFG